MGDGGDEGHRWTKLSMEFPLSDESRVSSVQRVARIADNLKEITYSYAYEVEVLAERLSHDFWYHVVPWEGLEVRAFAAHDDEGDLRSELHDAGSLTEALIFYRHPERKRQKFSFSYTVPFTLVGLPRLLKTLQRLDSHTD